MKRLLSSVIALTLGLGPVPAQAQSALGRASLPSGMTAPTPVPSALAPAAGIFAPALSAPSLSLAAPAPHAPLATLPALPVPAALSATAAAAPAPVKAETPLETLRRASAPGPALRLDGVFDGSLARSAPASVEPAAAPEAAAKPRRTLLQRYRDRRAKTPLQNAFGKAMFATALTAASAPVLWGAAPALKYVYAVLAADLMMLAIILPLAAGAAVWRKLRSPPQTAAKPPPSRRAKIAVIAAGVVLGLGLAAAPYYATGPVVEQVSNVVDRHVEASEKRDVRWLRGGAAEDETIKELSRNAVGRELLDKLRDRGGVIRLPSFFISRQDDSHAQHEKFFDGVYLAENEITERGWTVEQVLKDHELQRRLIREMNSTVFHELVHAVQGRRAPWTTGYFTLSTEAEQEAFLRQTLFLIAELEAGEPRNDHGRWMISDAASDLDGYLKTVAGMYEENVVVGDPHFKAFLAEQRARWPAFRVHAYRVLASRASTPASAKMFMDKAKAAAEEAGLPAPAPLAASR